MTPAALVGALAALGALAHDGERALAPADPEPRALAPAPDIVVPALHGLALMTAMRATETVLWPEPFARTEQFASSYLRAFTNAPIFDGSQPFMRWDGDPLVVNVAGHGLFGSEIHMRARTCGFPWAGALAFSAVTSALWEYGFEANGVRPSALDLVYTPLAGLVLGEARYVAWRAAGGIASPGWRSVTRAIVDPFGEIERALGTRC